jgi:hypothetical protein
MKGWHCISVAISVGQWQPLQAGSHSWQIPRSLQVRLTAVAIAVARGLTWV